MKSEKQKSSRKYLCGILAAVISLSCGCKTSVTKNIWDENAPIAGAASRQGKVDVPDSPYFKQFDFYNRAPSKSAILITKFPTIQQKSEYSCGATALLMVLRYYQLDNGLTEFSLAQKVDVRTSENPRCDGGIGCKPESIAKTLRTFGCQIAPTRNFVDIQEFAVFLKQQLLQKHPIIVESADWGGHYQVIIGYDDMGSSTTADDVLIMADPYDTSDHQQDGYVIKSLERFFAEWFDPAVTGKTITRQPYIAPIGPIKKACLQNR